MHLYAVEHLLASSRIRCTHVHGIDVIRSLHARCFVSMRSLSMQHFDHQMVTRIIWHI
jgi:hypothetical protein